MTRQASALTRRIAAKPRWQVNRRHFCGLCAAGAAAQVAACSVNPATGRSSFTGFMSPSEEKRVGAEQHPEIVKEFGGEYGSAELRAYVSNIGNRLAANTENAGQVTYTFTILNSDVVNAFALPGGYVYITRGLMALADDEAQLAGVIGHEIGHVVARHSAERYSKSVAANIGAVLLGIAFGGGAAQVTAVGPNNSQIIFDLHPGKAPNVAMTDYIARTWATNVRLEGLEAVTVNGMRAATGVTRQNTSVGAADIRLLAILGSDGYIFRFLFVTPVSLTARLDEGLRRTTYSFRRLSASEAGDVRPLLLRIIQARRGDSFTKLASALPFDSYREERFATLNGIAEGAPIQAGDRLKTVSF